MASVRRLWRQLSIHQMHTDPNTNEAAWKGLIEPQPSRDFMFPVFGCQVSNSRLLLELLFVSLNLSIVAEQFLNLIK